MSQEFVQVLIGVSVGALARFGLPGRNPGGLLISVILGIAGAFVAPLVRGWFGWYQTSDLMGWLVSAVGAVAFVAVYRFLSGTTAAPAHREDEHL